MLGVAEAWESSAIVWMGELQQLQPLIDLGQMADLIKMPFGVMDQVGKNNSVLFQIHMWEEFFVEMQCIRRMSSVDVALHKLCWETWDCLFIVTINIISPYILTANI